MREWLKRSGKHLISSTESGKIGRWHRVRRMSHAPSNGILFDCRDHALGTFAAFPLLDLK